jgi:phytoene synthase
VTDLAASFRHCREVTRRRARNFHYAFLLLDAGRRDAVSAIYAFMRHCDDLGDDDSHGDAAARRALLEAWRAQLERTVAGEPASDPLWPAFRETVARYRIPREYFFEMIEGVLADLEPRDIATEAELDQYCYRVASVAGLSLVHILGFQDEDALRLAARCGIAFQLTNILRDIGEDAARGRVYLPREHRERFGVAPEDLRSAATSPALRRLVEFEAARTRALYNESEPLIEMVNPEGRRALAALIQIYRGLLDRIGRSGWRVLERRVRLSAWEKSWIALRALAGGAN